MLFHPILCYFSPEILIFQELFIVKSSIKWGEPASNWIWQAYTAMLLGSHATATQPFENPMSKPSQSKIKKNHHNCESTCHTKFWHGALQLTHPNTCMCKVSRLFENFVTFNSGFLVFVGELSKKPKNWHFVDFDWEKYIQMAWVVHLWVCWGLPNAMVLVMSPEESKFQVKSSITWGELASKWNGTYTAMLLGSHSTPTQHLRTLCLNFPSKIKKNHHNSESTCHTKF